MGAVGCLHDRDRSIRNRGGNVPIVVDTLVFDNSQITSKLNYSHPTWGGAMPPSHRRSRTSNSGNQV